MYSDEDEERAIYSKKEDKKSEPKKGKKEEKKPEKEEGFYDDFYDYMSTNSFDDDGDIDDEPDLELEARKRKRAHFAVIGLLVIILIFLILLVTRSCDHKIIVEDKKEELVIKTTTIELYVGEEKAIDYRTLNFKNDPELTFTSMDPSVAEVSTEGKVKGLKKGETEVVITYFVDEVSYEKKCTVIVKEKDKPVNPPKPTPDPPKPTDKTPPTLTVNITNAKDNTWVNHDVTIKVSAKDDSKVTIKYALDCTNNCTYNNVSNGQITISKSGTTIVSIQAIDANNNKSSKNVTIKIDKEKPTCSMNVSEQGIITATVHDNGDLVYFGWNSGYTGTTTKTRDAHAGTYKYYVKDAVGNTNMCTITVKSKTQYRSKECAQEHRNTSKKRCNWGSEQFGAWQDTPISGSTYVLVETRTIFYK
jgi:hypothetical protein